MDDVLHAAWWCNKVGILLVIFKKSVFETR